MADKTCRPGFDKHTINLIPLSPSASDYDVSKYNYYANSNNNTIDVCIAEKCENGTVPYIANNIISDRLDITDMDFIFGYKNAACFHAPMTEQISTNNTIENNITIKCNVGRYIKNKSLDNKDFGMCMYQAPNYYLPKSRK